MTVTSNNLSKDQVDLREELKAVRAALNEVSCALMNRIRSERAFEKYTGIAEAAIKRATRAIGDGDE